MDTSSLSSDGKNVTSKSLVSMNLDELLDRLPHLKVDVIKGLWLQTARRSYEQFKKFLHEAGSVNLASQNELKDFGDVY